MKRQMHLQKSCHTRRKADPYYIVPFEFSLLGNLVVVVVMLFYFRQ